MTSQRTVSSHAPWLEAMATEASKRGRGIPVSVKCRVGVAERAEDFAPRHCSSIDAAAAAEVDERLYARLESFTRMCVSAGAAHVVVHAREAVMAGLSPRGNREVPPLRPELAGRLARALLDRGASASGSDCLLTGRDDRGGGVGGWSGRVAVTLNGGISSIEAARAAAEKWPELSGVQAGRWPLRRPTDMLAVDAAFYGRTATRDEDCASSVRCETTPGSVRLAGAGGAAAAAATRALESYVFRYALRELDAGDATLGELCRPLALVLADLDDRVGQAAAADVDEGDDEEEGEKKGGGMFSTVGDNFCHVYGSDADGGGHSRGGPDPKEAAAVEEVRSALLECAAALLDGGGEAGAEFFDEKKTRKALAKAVGKKIEKKHRGNRAEALAVAYTSGLLAS